MTLAGVIGRTPQRTSFKATRYLILRQVQCGDKGHHLLVSFLERDEKFTRRWRKLGVPDLRSIAQFLNVGMPQVRPGPGVLLAKGQKSTISINFR